MAVNRERRQDVKIDYKGLHDGKGLTLKSAEEKSTGKVETLTEASAGASHQLLPEVHGQDGDDELGCFSDIASDAEMEEMKEQLKQLQKEEKELQRSRQKEVLREQIRQKTAAVNKLKGTKFVSKFQMTLDDTDKKVVDVTPKIDINYLRKDKHLLKNVKKQVKKLGLVQSDSDSSSDSDESDISTTSDSTDSTSIRINKHVKSVKHKKSKKSGINAKSSDKVKNSQRYPHSQLRYEYVNQNVTFQELNLSLFVAGELEIISDEHTGSIERKGRSNLLKRMMYLSSTYNFTVLKSYYAAVLREIELGEKSWSDDFHYLEIAIFSKANPPTKYSMTPSTNLGQHNVNTVKGRKFSARSYSENVAVGEDSVWFCSFYQRNKCQHKTSHTVVVKGKMKWAQHICASCWQKEQKKLEHPECSTACPNAGS